MCAKRKDGRNPDSGDTTRGDGAQPENDKTLDTDVNKKSDPELIRGKILEGKYEILSHLGSGAMGAVYKARHSVLKKEVAIKILAAAADSDPVKRERFMREARAQGALTHRNIAAVHDVGFTETDQPFFVMDLLQGQSLEQRLSQDSSLECEEFITIFEQVARGLQHAHSKGLVHRDIKPSNIMLIDSDDGELHALVVDFGIAADSESELTKLTKAGYVIGTPSYMSPEQIEAKTLDARSDIYSLGCVMFESLTGRPPFTGSSAPATMALHLAQQPEHVSTLKTKSPLPNGLADLVMKCLEKIPDKRFSNAKEIAAQLNNFKRETSSKPDEIVPASKKEYAENAGNAGNAANPAPSPAAVEGPSAKVDLKSANNIELKSSDKIDPSSVKNDANTKAFTTANQADISKTVNATGTTHSSAGGDFEADRKRFQNQDATDTNTQGVVSPPPVVPPANFSTLPSNSEKKSFEFNGRDIVAMAIVGGAGLFLLPLNDRLVMPLSASEMRDDNPFFWIAKNIVGLWNQLAAHDIYQWVLWLAILTLIYNVIHKLLFSEDDN